MTVKTIGEPPKGELSLRTLTMPKDTNPLGDIFGGWVLSQMDIAGGVFSSTYAKGRTVTIAVEAMKFIQPVLVGDVLCCYVDVEKLGRTSITLNIQAWVSRNMERFKVTEGIFTFVAVDENRKPRPIEKQPE